MPLVLLIFFLAGGLLSPGETQRQVAPGQGGPVYSQAVNFAISGRARNFRAAAPTTEVDVPVLDREVNELNAEEGRQAAPGVVQDRDAAVQSHAGPNALTAPIVSFDGLSSLDNFNAFGFRVSPPDTNMDVGPNHIVETTNLLVRIFDKSGNPLTAPFKMSTLFTALGGPCATRDDGDPIVLYDALADRWLISQFCTLASPTTHQLIAISQTGDPTGAYFLYDFLMPNNRFNDYPHFGVWPDGYYMTDNQFVGNSSAGAGAFAFDRRRMLMGDPRAGFIYFDLNFAFPLQGIFGALPSDLDGLTPPPAGRPNTFAYFIATEFGNASDGMRLFDFHADFDNPSASTFTERAESPIAVAAFNPLSPTGRDDILQPAPATTGAALDSISDRLMHRLQYRNFGTHESLVTTHTVNISGSTTLGTYQAGVRYYEFRRPLPSGAFAVQEQGSFAPDTSNRWMASAAMDAQSNLAVGYSVSSSTVFPSIRYAARLASDTPGTLGQGEQELIAGSGVQTNTGSRWGDYSMLSVDPSDDCTFWYTTEYYTAASQATSSVGWLTRIGSFRVASSCPTLPQGALQGAVTNIVTGLPITNALVQTSDGYARNTDAAGAYLMTPLPPGTYNCTASAVGYMPAQATGLSVTDGNTTTQNFSLTPIIDLDFVSATITGGNGNGTIDGNECNDLSVTIKNLGAKDSAGLSATLSTTTPGVTLTQPNSPYPNLAAGSQSANTVAFSVSTTPGFLCGETISFTLLINYTGGSESVYFSLPSCACPPTVVTGSIAASDPQQSLRLTRDGLASTCTAPKGACPGPFSTGTRSYDQHSFTNTSTQARCVTASLISGCGTGIFAVAYLGSFDPNNVCTNYLADAGSSVSGTSTWSFTVPAGATFIVVVHEVNMGANCASYTLSIAGLACNNDGGGACAACSISCPANIISPTEAGQCGATVAYSNPTTSGTCGVVSCSPPSGSFFPKGTTTVNCSTTSGASCSFTVTVNDTQPPAIACPAGITSVAAVSCPIPAGRAVAYTTPTPVDNCPGATVACVPPSGATFPVGTTTVTCTATDASGNTASCSFSVKVFNICLQDDSNPNNRVFINTATGEYQLFCGSNVFSGVASVNKTGCTVALDQNAGGRRLRVNLNTATRNGSAYFQVLGSGVSCSITDRNMADNNCNPTP